MPRSLRLAPLLVAAGIAVTACGSAQSPRQAVSPAPHTANAAAQPLCPEGLTACVSTARQATVRGPGSAADKLRAQLRRSNPTLTPLSLVCPSRTNAYPFQCALEGRIESASQPVDVTGSINVLGIETATDTYAYELNYAPIR